MQDLVWLLLLPVAAASGWWVASRSYRRGKEQVAPEFTSDYIKGLNYLLNEQTDKAIELFIRMLEVNSDTVETHLALGSLFRRRGEVDRAIRIHQNLIARPTLTTEQRGLALLELADDYMRAGLLDRAENLFLELIELNLHNSAALWHLLDIYQQEKEWDKAIAVAHRIESDAGKPMDSIVAQYCCELAERSLDHDDYGEAVSLLHRALESDRNCVRASLLIGRLERERGNCGEALKAYQQVLQQDVEFTPEVVDPLISCYTEMGKSEEIPSFLNQIVEAYPAVKSVLRLAELLEKREGREAAEQFMLQQQRSTPSLRGLRWVIHAQLDRAVEQDGRAGLQLLDDLTGKLIEGLPSYHCQQCGFDAKRIYWQCPSCKRWNTVKPVKGVGSDANKTPSILGES